MRWWWSERCPQTEWDPDGDWVHDKEDQCGLGHLHLYCQCDEVASETCVCPATGFEIKPTEGRTARLNLLLRMFFLTLATHRGQKTVYLLASSDTTAGMWLVYRLPGCFGGSSPLYSGRSQGFRAEDTGLSLLQEPSDCSCSRALLWGSLLGLYR